MDRPPRTGGRRACVRSDLPAVTVREYRPPSAGAWIVSALHAPCEIPLGGGGPIGQHGGMSHPAPAGSDAQAPVAGRIHTTAPVSIDHAVRSLVAHMELRELSAKHIVNIRRAVAKAARDMGWATVEDITAGSVRDLLTSLQAAGRSPKTRNEYRSALSLLCGYAAAEGWVRESPIGRTPRAKLVRRRARRVPSVDEVRRLIEAARADWRKRDRWLVYLTAATTGLRWGQLRGLEWAHVHLDADPPHLALPASLCKNGETAVVWLTSELASALAAARGVEYDFVPNSGRRDAGLVFRGVPKPTSFDRDLEAAGLAKAGPGGATFSFHSLRHFASNRMQWVGFSPRERQRQNQHLTLAMTTRVYTDPENIELGRKVLSMPDLLAEPRVSGVGATGKSAPEDLTERSGSAEMSPAVTTPPHHTNDSQAAARAVGVVTADPSYARAAPSGSRVGVGRPGKSGRQDLNPPPRSSPAGRGAAPRAMVPGRDADPRELRSSDPLLLALESAEAAIRFARSLAARRPDVEPAPPAHPGDR